jgi:hypothetical protein
MLSKGESDSNTKSVSVLVPLSPPSADMILMLKVYADINMLYYQVAI